MIYAPIALFVYKRPFHTKRTIEALAQNTYAQESELFIFSDAPKEASAHADVERVREYISTAHGFKKITIITREYNAGLAESIIDGVTDIVKKYGKVIVLEDDIVTSPAFLEYMNDALNTYEKETRVMHINGYSLPGGVYLPRYFFYNQTLCWGWATWGRAWEKFSRDVDEHICFLQAHPERNKKMYLKNALSTLRANKRGDEKTWAAFWQASLTKADGFCLSSNQAYACTIGHDNSGEHKESSDVFAVPLAEQHTKLEKIPLQESAAAVNIANRFWKKYRGSYVLRLLRKIKQCLQ